MNLSPTELNQWMKILQHAFQTGEPPDSWPEQSLDTQDWKQLVEELLSINRFTQKIAGGDLSGSLDVNAAIAGSLETIQSNLLHLTSQVQRIAAGDLDQHIELMGDLATSLNQMIHNFQKIRTGLLESEARYRLLAEALSNTTFAINSAKNLDEIFDVLIENIRRVIPYDSIEIWTMEPTGDASIKRSGGFHQFNHDAPSKLEELSLPVETTPNLRTMRDTGQPFLLDDLSGSNWIETGVTHWAKSQLGSPILVKGKVVGFLVLLSTVPGFFTEEHVWRLRAFADHAAVAIEKSNLSEQINEMETVDSLTGIANRRHFLNLTEQEMTRAIRYGRPLSALMLDIDNFKQVNDTFGHNIGDEVLAEIAQRCRQQLRSVDLFGRYGGEEFSFLLPETDSSSAMIVADRLQKVISKTPFTARNEAFKVTVSIGVTGFKPNIPSARALLDQADQALYRAKQSGRNKIARLG